MKSMILTLLLAAFAAWGNSWYSVMVPDLTRSDIEFLHSSGFDIEAVFGTRARIHVTREGELMLRSMGYATAALETPEPLVPYPGYAEIVSAMQAVVTGHPEIASLEQIGTSVQGRAIYAVILTETSLNDPAKPLVRITGTIHGDEKSSTMTTLNFLTVVADNYGTSDMCTYLLDNAEVWVIPVLNPDGYVNDSRYNANSVDLNRNLSYMWSGGGPYAFSEPETQALRDITMQSWPEQNNFINPFATGLSFHSGAECVNTVWNYSVSAVIQDLDLVTAQGEAYGTHPSIIQYYGSWDIWIPGASWYPTNGDVNDWSYGEVGTVDHTIEVSNIKSPSDWPGVANANYMPMLEFCISSTHGIHGTVTDGGSTPLDALIEVERTDGTDSSPLRFCRNDVLDGGYSKALVPGTYTVTATVNGLGSLVQSGIEVGASETVRVDFMFGTGIEGGSPEAVYGGMFPSPNPATSHFRITLPDTGVEGLLQIYDISGRTVYEETIAGGVTEYSMGTARALPGGVYLVHYSSYGISASARIVVAE